MKKFAPRCSKCGGDKKVIKDGISKNRNQRYKCKECGVRFQLHYTYVAYKPSINHDVKCLLKEGLGIRSIGRFLRISPSTVISRILKMAEQIHSPIIRTKKQYELDEMCTFIGSKEKRFWIVYALDRRSKVVVDFRVGKRANKTLRPVVKNLLLSDPKKIFTDKLRNYRFLIPKKIHSVKWRGTNHIERKNLTLRTHLKRLNRRTICYSKSLAMLVACLKIYFWG